MSAVMSVVGQYSSLMVPFATDCFWNSTLDAFLKEMQFTQTASDPYIHYRKAGKDIMFIGVYVDDIILAAKNEKQLKQVKEDLSNDVQFNQTFQLSLLTYSAVHVSDLW